MPGQERRNPAEAWGHGLAIPAGRQQGAWCRAIEGVGPPTTPHLGSWVAARATGRFRRPSAPGAATQANETLAAEPASLASVATLQELGAETVEDREARRHGQDMLALLAALQHDLLSGVDNVAALRQLADLAVAVPPATDQRLAAMISAIVVRVRVELARRQV